MHQGSGAPAPGGSRGLHVADSETGPKHRPVGTPRHTPCLWWRRARLGPLWVPPLQHKLRILRGTLVLVPGTEPTSAHSQVMGGESTASTRPRSSFTENASTLCGLDGGASASTGLTRAALQDEARGPAARQRTSGHLGYYSSADLASLLAHLRHTLDGSAHKGDVTFAHAGNMPWNTCGHGAVGLSLRNASGETRPSRPAEPPGPPASWSAHSGLCFSADSVRAHRWGGSKRKQALTGKTLTSKLTH